MMTHSKRNVRAVVLMLFVLTGCRSITPTHAQQVMVTPVITLPLPTWTQPVTPAPRSTPETVESAVSRVSRALQAGDATALSAMLTERVLLTQAPSAALTEFLGRDAAIDWLTTRWGSARSVVSSGYIEHFVLLEIETAGWEPIAPVQSGVMIFHLHRYDEAGQADPLGGNWRIDAILYR